MTPHLLHLSFPYDGPWDEAMARSFGPLALTIARTPGLLWKVWTEDRAQQRAGGTYLFESEAAADAYLAEHLPRLAGFGIVDVRMERYAANPVLSALTRALPQVGQHTVLGDVAVADFDKFLEVFAGPGQEARLSHGSRGARVYRVAGEPQRAMVLIDWSMVHGFEAFLADPHVQATMKRGGALRPPQFTHLSLVQQFAG